MKLGYWDILLQEVPGEISLGLGFSGCKLRCDGCHSKDLWDENYGQEFNASTLTNLINKYKGKLTCVCFFGGEWDPDLLKFNEIAKSNKLKTCLYTGLDVPFGSSLFNEFDFIKVGPYKKELGGLRSKTTNQRFYSKINDEWVDQSSIFVLN